MPFGDYYGSWRAMEELYREGKIHAIGVCNFYPDRLMDLCYNVEITPQINQIERHPHYQRKEDLEIMEELGIQVLAWAPFAEGMKGMFDESILKEIAGKYGKDPGPGHFAVECAAGSDRYPQISSQGAHERKSEHLGF